MMDVDWPRVLCGNDYGPMWEALNFPVHRRWCTDIAETFNRLSPSIVLTLPQIIEVHCHGGCCKLRSDNDNFLIISASNRYIIEIIDVCFS